MKKVTSSIYLILLIVSAFAQTYQPGYIINNNNDTIRGKLYCFYETQCCKKVVFLDHSNNNKTRYRPGKIKAYNRGGFVYERKKVSWMPFGVPLFPINCFMKLSIKGTVSLYIYYWRIRACLLPVIYTTEGFYLQKNDE